MHAPKLSHAAFICAKYFFTFSTDIAVHAQNPICPADTRKIWCVDKASLYIIPISSQQRSQPRKGGFVWKTFQISVPMSVRFLQDFSSKFAAPESWNFFRKANGKKQFFLYVAPAPIGTTQYMSTLLYLVAGV